jgi:hypothetical protein
MAATRSLNKAELTDLGARLCRIDIVSWRWNFRGRLFFLFSSDFFKAWHRTEIGVIAQTVKRELGDIYPNIVVKNRLGAYTVDYGCLANLSLEALPDLDRLYQIAFKSQPETEPLVLQKLLDKYLTSDTQLAAVRLLALVHLYNERLQTIAQP